MTSNLPLKFIVCAVAVLCLFVLFLMTFYSVGQYERVVLTRFGHVVQVSEPGLHFKVPFMYNPACGIIKVRFASPAESRCALGQIASAMGRRCLKALTAPASMIF